MPEKETNIKNPQEGVLGEKIPSKKEATQIPFTSAEELKEVHEKDREKVKAARKKPGKQEKFKQQDQTAETIRSNVQDEESNLEKILLKEGSELKAEDFKEVYDAIPELFSKTNPELRNYLKGFSPRLETILQETADLKGKKLDAEAYKRFAEFLSLEMKHAEVIKDPALKKFMISQIGALINIEQLEQDVDSNKNFNYFSKGMDALPAVGSMKMAYETYQGRTATGEKLEGLNRAVHGGMAVAGMAFDAFEIATGIETLGAGVVVGEAGKIAVKETAMAIGKYAAKEAAITVGKSAAKGTASAAINNYLGKDIPDTIHKFSALCHKTPELKKAAVIMYKTGNLMNKYPKMTEAIENYSKVREQSQKMADAYAKSRLAGEKWVNFPT